MIVILGLGFTLAYFFSFQSNAFSVNDGLIAYWSFEEIVGNITWDNSGNSNDGVVSKDLWEIPSKVGLGFVFNGDDYVDVGNRPSLNFDSTESFTISAWVKLDNSIEDWRVIAGKANTSSLNGYVLRHSTNGNLNMMIEDNGDDYSQSNAIAREDYRDDKWHHVVGVINRQDNTNTIYVDGIQKDQSNIDYVNDLINNYLFNIGSLGKTGLSFKGFIDEVRVYQKALSSDEITQLYNQDCECLDIVPVQTYPAGSLLQATNSDEVYYINKKNQKKWIVNKNMFDLYNNKWEDVIEVEPQDLEQYPSVNLIKGDNDKVYFIQEDTKQWIKTIEEFNQAGYDWNNINVVNSLELSEYK